MPDMRALARDTAIYGLSSIVGRFLNYLLVPLYTARIAAQSGGYGVVTNLYAYTALILVVLTFGMETTFFRFANKDGADASRVFATSLAVVGGLSAAFMAAVLGLLPQLSCALGYGAHPEWVWMMALTVSIDSVQAVFFAMLRYEKRAVKFAGMKLLFIVLNMAANIVYFCLIGRDVTLVFALNLACTALMTLLFIPEMRHLRARPEWRLMRRMLSYSWPILILGIAGILNQTFDKMVFPLVSGHTASARVELGIYGASVKVAMIMAMITQAFRYAYEPIVFAQSRERGAKEMYARAMELFIAFTLLAFLAVVGYMDLLRHIIGADYREGLRVVPIVMAAEIMMGVYFNLSFWYKLIDRTIYGAWFSLAGCAVLVAVNVLFIPRYSYMACAWGGVAGYGTAMLLSYFVGQRRNPIAYPLRSILVHTALAAAIFAAMSAWQSAWSAPVRLALNTVLVLAYAAFVARRDLPRGAVGRILRRGRL